MTLPLKIEAIYAFIATDENGQEGIVGATLPGCGSLPIPLIGADRARIESLRHFAEMANKINDYPVQLIKFWQKEVLETL